MRTLGQAWRELLEWHLRPTPSIRWFDRWEPAIEEALRALPELEHCPPELMREVYETSSYRKRIALVQDGRGPLAVVPLKHVDRRWRPITTWILPATLFPARPGEAFTALATLPMPVHVEWWRQPVPPPSHAGIRYRRDTSTHRIACIEEDEAHWRRSGLLNKVRRSRKRCAGLQVEINRPGAARWAIENWGRLWATGAHDCIPHAAALIAMSRFWEPRGRHLTVALMDGDRFAAAATLFILGRDLVGMCNYRDRDYDPLLIGTRLFDAVHQWALANGMASIDFGHGHRYMKDWAPQSGSISEITVRAPRPFPSRLVHAAARSLAKMTAGVQSAASRTGETDATSS